MHKRYEMRRSFGIPLEVITANWDDPIGLIAGDLSPRGTFIQSEMIPDFGEQVVCSFNLKPGAREYCFFGEVTRINMLRRKTDMGHPGFGVKFLDTSPIERLAIRHSLRGLPPPIPSPQRRQIEPATLDMLM
jgi:hypothetical protein